MKNTYHEELVQVVTKFVESGWDLIADPSKTWLDGNGDAKELLAAILKYNRKANGLTIFAFH